MSLREFGGTIPVGTITSNTPIPLPKQPALSRLSTLTFDYTFTSGGTNWAARIEWIDGAGQVYAMCSHLNSLGAAADNGICCFGLGLEQRLFASQSPGAITPGELMLAPLPWQTIVTPGSKVQLVITGSMTTNFNVGGIRYRFRTFD